MQLNFMNLSDFRLKAKSDISEPVIDGFLDKKEFMLLHASAKTGKSMLALNLALSVSTGRDFLGWESEIGKVLYLQTEINDRALDERIDKMLFGQSEQIYELAKMNFFIATNRIQLDQEKGISLLTEEVKREKPILLIIDPLYDLHKKNEDNATEMAPLLSDIREISRECDCAVILIHHQGKKAEGFSTNAGHACRGSSAFADVPDSSVSLSKDKEGYCLRGIFRNRSSLEDFRLSFNQENLMFECSNDLPKRMKTKDIILNLLDASPVGLTKKEIVAKIGLKQGIQSSAIQKQLENLVFNNKILLDETSKETKFSLSKIQGGNISSKENNFLSASSNIGVI